MRITVLANPKRFLDLSRILMPWVCGAAFLLLAAGFYWALFDTPPDYQQGQSVKIMFVHVPAAYMGIMIYGVMAAASLTGLVFRHPLADVAAKSAAPLGAAFTALALLTGSLWGRPMWGKAAWCSRGWCSGSGRSICSCTTCTTRDFAAHCDG